MEELLAKFLRVLVELVFQVIGNFWNRPSKLRERSATETAIHASGAWLFGGIIAGAAWAYAFPAFILPNAMLRIGNLVVSPMLSGGVGYFIAQHRAKANPNIRPNNYFWYLLLFAFGLVTTRFAFTR
jgi:hypothetical protein